jgi:hypothetical protein
VAWLDAMAPAIRDGDFLPLVLVFTPPGFLYRSDPGEPWSEVSARIRTLRPDPIGQMPAILSLIGAIDFVFHRRSTKGDWDLARQKYFQFVDEAEAKGKESFAARMRESGEALQFKAGHWIRNAELWWELRAEQLAPDRLQDWIQAYRPSGER